MKRASTPLVDSRSPASATDRAPARMQIDCLILPAETMFVSAMRDRRRHLDLPAHLIGGTLSDSGGRADHGAGLRLTQPARDVLDSAVHRLHGMCCHPFLPLGSMEEELEAISAGLATTITVILDVGASRPRPSTASRPITDASARAGPGPGGSRHAGHGNGTSAPSPSRSAIGDTQTSSRGHRGGYSAYPVEPPHRRQRPLDAARSGGVTTSTTRPGAGDSTHA